MDKKDLLTNDVLIADTLLRLKTLEMILVEKGVFTKEEYDNYMEMASSEIAKAILAKANVPGDLDEIVKSLKSDKIS